MTLLKITQIGHPVLVAAAEPVGDPTDPPIRLLAEDMIETMLDAHGLGLAAPQVYRGLRLIVLRPVADRDEACTVDPQVLINPVLDLADPAMEDDVEGCLSIPHLRGVVPRHRRIGWRGQDRFGRTIAGEATGLHARILQHEVDHLDGILFPMRMADLRRLATSDQVGHLREQSLRGSAAG